VSREARGIAQIYVASCPRSLSSGIGIAPQVLPVPTAGISNGATLRGWKGSIGTTSKTLNMRSSTWSAGPATCRCSEPVRRQGASAEGHVVTLSSLTHDFQHLSGRGEAGLRVTGETW